MENRDYKKLTISNMFWHFLERFGAQGVTFVVSIILARLLEPSDYGTVSLITVFTSILSIFISGGLSTALVQKKDADDLDFSSMFYFNVFMCLTLYAVMFFSAPAIANFYGLPELTALTRVSSLSLIISGVKGVQSTYVSKNLIFKKFFFATLGGTIGAAFIGIWMAFHGFGCWALVIQSLFNHLVDTIILWFTVKWRPKWLFSFKRLGALLRYGWKVLAVVLVNRVYINLRTLIIGKKYSTNDLAFYNKGGVFPNTAMDIILSSIDAVMFPVFSMEQDNIAKVRDMLSKSIKTSTYFIMPMMMGLAVCAEPITRIVLTEKWLPMVYFMRIFCFTYAFSPINSNNISVIKALGRSDILLRIEILKKSVGLIIIAITMFISVKAMAIGAVVSCLFELLINTWPNRKLLNYSLINQIKDILPQIVLSGIMGVAVFGLSFLHVNSVILLPLQVISGLCLYIGGSVVLKIDTLWYVLTIIKNYSNK